MRDLPQYIHSAIPFIFADDTKCLLAIKSTSDSDKLQQDINNISTWSYTFNLLFNESKFVHLCFWQKTSLDTPRYAINGNLIRRMSQHKDLGVTFPLTFTGRNITTLLLPKLTKPWDYSIVLLVLAPLQLKNNYTSHL